MAWEWVTNSARKAAELGAEYLKHSSLIDRLVQLPPDAADADIQRTWPTLDERARSGLKMTLGAQILKQQAIATADGKARLQRLVDLRNSIDRASGGTATADSASTAKPWSERVAALRRELDTYRPQIEAKGAATWNALSSKLNALAARAEAMGKDPEARAAFAKLRDAMIAALAAHVAAQKSSHDAAQKPSHDTPLADPVIRPGAASHDEEVEALLEGAGALASLGVSQTDLLQNMVDAALREERESGILSAARQTSYAHLSVSLKEAARIKDASAQKDRCRELAAQLVTLTHNRPTVSTADGPSLDDDSAKQVAQLEQFEQELEQAIADGKMTPARAATYRAQVAEARLVMSKPPKNDAEAIVFRSRLNSLIDRQLESMETIAPQAEGTRAHFLQGVTGRLQSVLLKELTRITSTTGDRETADALGVRVFEARRIVEELKDDSSARELEVETLRRVAAEVHLFQRRHHLTLISPPWASPEARSEASGVFCAAAADLIATLRPIAAERRLKLLSAAASGKDPGQDAWNRLRAAAVAIFDLREYEAIEEHGDLARAARTGAVCYELGIAYCLGVPAIIVARANQRIPFDLDLTPVQLTGDTSDDEAALGEAIDEAFYGSQRVSAGDSVPATFDYFVQTWANAPQDAKLRETVTQMKQEAGGDAVLAAQLIGHGISLIKNHPPRLAYPILPGCYPGATPQCFIVMPFRDHVNAGYRLIVEESKKARIEDIRGDATADEQILRSIWDEIGRASHVTVDLTDFNPNVCLELGIADTLGRPTILLGRPGTEKALFPSIAKRRVHIYTGDTAGDKGVRTDLAGFFTRKPASQPVTSPAPQPVVPAPQPVRPQPPALPPPVQTLGGLWSGILRSASGETMETTIRISPGGRTMYCYRDTEKYREVELTHQGQRIQYVPPNLGVVTVTVMEVASTPRGCGHLIAWSFQRSANGYMDQQFQRIAMQCELKGDKLAVSYAEAGENYMSDIGTMLGGGTTSKKYSGILEREKEP